MIGNRFSQDVWPELNYHEWQDTCTTLHLWTQIVGKIRLVKTPWINHSWHVTLYVTPRGLSTSPMVEGTRQFQIDFDFIEHALIIQVSDGQTRSLPLQPMAVADFYSEVFAILQQLGIAARINTLPNEMSDPIPFPEDRLHSAYAAAYAQRFWRVLLQCDRVFKRFRAGFIGKCSPVHFFWGSFDLAVTRFSGRPAPVHPGGIPHLPDAVTREAYSQEVSSAGFWPGGSPIDYAAFYSYAYPLPAGFNTAPMAPEATSYHPELGEFLLPYDAVRAADNPDGMLHAFLQSTYEAAANGAGWQRAALERDPVPPS